MSRLGRAWIVTQVIFQSTLGTDQYYAAATEEYAKPYFAFFLADDLLEFLGIFRSIRFSGSIKIGWCGFHRGTHPRIVDVSSRFSGKSYGRAERAPITDGERGSGAVADRDRTFLRADMLARGHVGEGACWRAGLCAFSPRVSVRQREFEQTSVGACKRVNRMLESARLAVCLVLEQTVSCLSRPARSVVKRGILLAVQGMHPRMPEYNTRLSRGSMVPPSLPRDRISLS